MEVIIGRVTKWDSKARNDGGWDCSLEIVSQNEGLLDHSISDRNNLKTKLVYGLGPFIINEVARQFGANFLRHDWASSKKTLQSSEVYASRFASELFGTPYIVAHGKKPGPVRDTTYTNVDQVDTANLDRSVVEPIEYAPGNSVYITNIVSSLHSFHWITLGTKFVSNIEIVISN